MGTKTTSGTRPIDLVIGRLESGGFDPRPAGGGGWESRCPVHQGSRHNLSIKEASDGIVLLDDPLERLLLEIKSIGINSLRYEAYSLFEKAEQEQMTPDEIWFLIKRPFPSHLRQGMLYLYLATIRYPELNINRIIFLYEWKPTQEVKEFVVTYNQTYIDNVLATVDDVYQALEQGEPPDRPAWAEITDKGCRSCEYRGTCWGSPHTKDQAAPQVRVKRVSAQRRKAIRS